MTYLRWTRLLLVAQVGLFATLVAINNIFDYGSNFAFVQHVLTMDTTFEGNSLMWRSIDQPTIHHLAYWMIIFVEALCGMLCLFGAWLLFKNLAENNAVFCASKKVATIGLLVGVGLWSTGFMTVGAEWFLMWQSQTWNGQEAAFRFITIIFASLIFLHLPEPEVESE